MYPSVKNKKPWFKFYPTDWQSDPALRICSIGARGLWVEMLAIMHQAEPYGHLLVQGRIPTHQQLAIVAGVALQDVQAYLAELEYAGVFSRTTEDIIYSRRMVRDEQRSEEGRLYGAKGGNPSLKRTRRNKKGGTTSSPPLEKPPFSPEVNQGVNPTLILRDNLEDNTPCTPSHIPTLKASHTREPETRGHIPEAIHHIPFSESQKSLMTIEGMHHEQSAAPNRFPANQSTHDIFSSALAAIVSEHKHD